MAIVSQSEFRANMAKLFKQIEDDATPLTVFRQGKEHMVVLPLSEYESWRETEYLMRDAANAKRLTDAIERLDSGKGIEVDFDADGNLQPATDAKS